LQTFTKTVIFLGRIPDFLQNEEHKAATKIQAHWRAHSQRKTYSAKKEFQQKVKATIVIQRAVCTFWVALCNVFNDIG